MHPKQVELLAERVREEQTPGGSTGALRHLEAARKKLARLQAGHDRLALSLAQSVSERDHVVRELERLRQRRQDEAVAIYRVQDAVIGELKQQLGCAIDALEAIESQAETMRFSPGYGKKAAQTARDALAKLGRTKAD